MSEGVTIAPAGERIEILQIGSETLLLAPVPSPSLVITPISGEQITLSPSVQNLILTASPRETLVIREDGGDTLLISDDTALGSPYGRPYSRAEDGVFYYNAWQHKDGARWKAQRFELETSDLRLLTGDNPQPIDLGTFEDLSW